MHDIPHYRCIMNLVMSTLNYICAHTPSLFSPFFPRLINIEGNGRSNSSCITTQGRVSSMHLKHTHMFPSVIQWEKKESHNTADQSCSACLALHSLGAPDRSSDVWDAGSPEFVHHWLIKTPGLPAQLQLIGSCAWVLTQALSKLIFTIRQKWTHTEVRANKNTQTHAHEGTCTRRQMRRSVQELLF